MTNDILGASPIAPQNWQSVLDAYQSSDPYNYAVIDNFLQPDVCEQLHQELLNHLGWRSQSHSEQTIVSNMKPSIKTIFTIAESLTVHCPALFSNYKLVEHWALMYPKNALGQVHSDIGALTLNIWLTPDRYNLDPSGGGLIFFDVKRESQAPPGKSVSYLWSEQYLKDFTRGQKVTVSYKCNRALLFDAKTFHKTDVFSFANTKPEAHRINLSLTFDDPEVYRDRVSSLRNASDNKSKA
ncbi:hypothetical protein [Scytonema sp. PCC 10023]|uniref:hypothetical protein n=1 Tax=Scytonema sp. PCC 10023 TaxID=1680591 RepID=UPI0039C6D01C